MKRILCIMLLLTFLFISGCTKPTAQLLVQSGEKGANSVFEFTAEQLFKYVKTFDEDAAYSRVFVNQGKTTAYWMTVGRVCIVSHLGENTHNVGGITVACPDEVSSAETGRRTVKAFHELAEFCGIHREDRPKLDRALKMDRYPPGETTHTVMDSVSCYLKWDKERLSFYLSPEGSSMDVQFKMPQLRQQDFFADQSRREMFDQARENLEFEQIVLQLDEYLAASPETEDSAYKIRPLFADAAAARKRCTAVDHPAEGVTGLYWQGVDELTEKAYLFPYYDNGARLRIGIRQKDWAVLEEIALVGEDGTKKWASQEIQRENIGRNVVEYVDIAVSDQQLSELLKEPLKVKMTGEKLTSVEAALGEAELEAIKGIRDIQAAVRIGAQLSSGYSDL